MRTLEEIRRDTAACDAELMRQLVRRLDFVEEITALKKEESLAILEPARETERTESMRDMVKGSPYCEELLEVLDSVVAASKKVQAKALFRHNILLVGFMGTGKSTVSAYLREMLAMDEVDTDDAITEAQGMSVNSIFAKYGEGYFRNCESELLRELAQRRHVIVSCGGGIVMREENIQLMKKSGRVVLLKANPATVLERVKNSNERPLLRGNMNENFIAGMMEKRRTRYERAADITVATDGRSVQEIGEEIVEKLLELENQ